MATSTRVGLGLPSLRGDQRGASLVEYLVLVGFIAIVGLLGFRLFGSSVDSKIQCQAAAVAADRSVCGGADGTPGAYALAAPAGAPGPGANGAGDPNAGAAATAGSNAATVLAAPADGGAGDDGARSPWYGLEQLGGYYGGLGHGIWDDVTGLWDLVQHPIDTLKGAWDGIYDRIETRAESDAAKASDQWKNGDQLGAAWTLAKGAWSSSQGLVLETLVVDEGVQADWKNGNYGGAAGRVVWNVGSMFIPGVGAGKLFGKLAKLTKLSKVEKVVDDVADVGKKVDVEDGKKIDKGDTDGTKKTDVPDIDPVTAATLEKAGLTPNSVVYRTMEPQYLDEATGTVKGNPDSIALVDDPYNLVDNPMVAQLEQAGIEVPPQIPRQIPRVVNAKDVGPGLNVARDNPGAYAAPGNVTVAIKVSDILKAGGKVYPDRGAMAQGIGPIYVTYDGAVPYTVVPP